MARVIITDVKYRMSIAAIRALALSGMHVTAVEYDTTPRSAALGFYCKYTARRAFVPNAARNSRAFAQGLAELARDEPAVLIPLGLDSIMAVIEQREYLASRLEFIVPSRESIRIANSTGLLIDVARRAGVPCPGTTTLQANETIAALADRISYPAVIKYSSGELLKLGPDKRYKIVHDRESFVSEYERMHHIQGFPLVQEYISGGGYGVSAVFDKNSEPLDIFCHKRIREYPVSGGPSCFCESIWDDRLVSYAVNLLKELKWQGVAMVEFKGELDGKIALMEINPRIWGSMPLTAAAGSNFMLSLYRASRGETAATPNHPTCSYQTGRQMRYLIQDLLAGVGYFKTSSNKAAFLRGFIRDLFNPRVANGLFSMDDCKPALLYLLNVLKKARR